MVLDTLYWEITDKCPLHCRHCYQGENMNNSKRILDCAESLKRVDTFAQNGIKTLLLTGGEPLENPNIYEIIKRSKINGLDIAVLTSGFNITKVVAEKIAEAAPNIVQISIDGLEKVHDYIRGKGTFRRIENAIDNLRANNVKFYMKMTINKLNIKDVLNVVEFCHSKNIQLNFSHVLSLGSAEKGNIVLNPKEYFDIFIKLYEKKYQEERNLILPNFAIEEYLNGEQIHSMCSAGRRIATLTFDDLFLPCAFLSGVGLKESDGVLIYSDDVIKRSNYDKLFNTLRKHSESSFDCPLVKLDNGGVDPFSLESFIKYTGEEYGILQKRSMVI